MRKKKSENEEENIEDLKKRKMNLILKMKYIVDGMKMIKI